MSRCTLAPTAPSIDLKQVVKEFVEYRSEADRFTKLKDSHNKVIKAEMKSRGLNTFDVDNIHASMTETANTEFNELQAIEILRKTLKPEEFANIVKTKEYIDSDALESAVFNKALDASILAPCTVDKAPTVTLRVTLKKGTK